MLSGEPSKHLREEQRQYKLWLDDFMKLSRADRDPCFSVSTSPADVPQLILIRVAFGPDVPSMAEGRDRVRSFNILWKHETPADAYENIKLGRIELSRDLGYRRYLKTVG
jgi:hypothetical protein